MLTYKWPVYIVARICGKNIMVVPVFIYHIITVDFYQLWLNFNVTSTKILTSFQRHYFDVATTKNIDVISTTLFRRLIDVVLRVMTSWRHFNVYSTSYRASPDGSAVWGVVVSTRWWLLVDHCVLRNWDRILVRAVKGLISRAGMVSICPLLWQRDVKLQQTKKNRRHIDVMCPLGWSVVALDAVIWVSPITP